LFFGHHFAELGLVFGVFVFLVVLRIVLVAHVGSRALIVIFHVLVLVADIFLLTLRGVDILGTVNIVLTLFLVEALAERIILIFVFSSRSVPADLRSFVSGSERNNIALAQLALAYIDIVFSCGCGIVVV